MSDPAIKRKNITKKDIELYKTTLITKRRALIKDQVKADREKQWYQKYGKLTATQLNLDLNINTSDFYNFETL